MTFKEWWNTFSTEANLPPALSNMYHSGTLLKEFSLSEERTWVVKMLMHTLNS